MSWNLKDLETSLLIGSTLVEGSTLTEKEAKQALQGKTVQGHPVSEIRELANYRSSVEWLMEEMEKSPYLSRDLLFEFHKRLFQGFGGEHGSWKRYQNYTFHSDVTHHNYVSPSKVEKAMEAWIAAFNKERKKNQSPESILAKLYYDFQQIHPFEDGNGRIGRILIAYWLHWKEKSSWSFYLKDKIEHLTALESANRGDFVPLTLFMKKRIKTK